MRSRGSLLPLAGLLGVLLAACGGGGTERAASSPDPTSMVTPSDMDRFLLRPDEVPGLSPVSTPMTPIGPPFELDQYGKDQLRRSGFISMTYQPAEGEGAGVSSVLLFFTVTGARQWMAYETSLRAIRLQVPGATIERFDVPGVPGATGWTGPDVHGHAIGQVYWTQGRCMLLIGLEIEGPRAERLSAGARAIYERTGGECPG